MHDGQKWPSYTNSCSTSHRPEVEHSLRGFTQAVFTIASPRECECANAEHHASTCFRRKLFTMDKCREESRGVGRHEAASRSSLFRRAHAALDAYWIVDD